MVWIRSGVSGGGRDHYRISVPNWGLRALDVLRSCQCDHPFPVCACSEGLTGQALVSRSKFLSSLGGWPRPPGAPEASTRKPPTKRRRSSPSGLSVAVVVISHNYGRFLSEALESVLAQTVEASEVLVIDDASDDDTSGVAARYADRGVRYQRVDHRHAQLSRRAGLEASTADVLLFLDADNRLPPNYLEDGLRVLADRRISISYPDLQSFDDSTELLSMPAFDAGLLERRNYIDAGSLVTRQALVLSRALDYPPGEQSHADWRMFRRLVDAGFRAARQDVPLLYRRHPGQMIRTATSSYYERAGLADELVTLFIPLSGRRRAWEEYLRPWLDEQTRRKDLVRLVLADTSQSDGFHQVVREWLLRSGYPDVRLYRQAVGMPGLADAPRIDHIEVVMQACARIYGRMTRELDTAYLVVVEDDERPPANLIDRLLRSMDEHTAAVSGLYRSRLQSAGGYVAWMNRARNGEPIWPAPGPPVDVGGTGFGAILLRRCFLKGETFESRPGDSDYYDVAYAQRMGAAGWRWKLDAGCLVDHMGAPPFTPEERRAAKPRVPLGTPPCKTCS